ITDRGNRAPVALSLRDVPVENSDDSALPSFFLYGLPAVFCGAYASRPWLNTTTFSCAFIGRTLHRACPVALDFSHIHSYLKSRMLLAINDVVNSWLAVNTMAALRFATLRYCAHSGSNGITVSHLQAVVPYGRSHRIISTDASDSPAITSRQSPW